MQSILSIDVTSEQACALVVNIDGRRASIVESHQFIRNGSFSRQGLLTPKDAPNITSSAQADNAGATAGSEQPLPPADLDTHLRETIQKITTPWTGSVIIVPTYEYLSLNVELPFGDTRSIEKVIELEVQDRVPFDLDEFLIHYRALNLLGDGRFDVHVGLVPKLLVKNSLQRCRAAGLEPMIVSTATSAIGGAYYLAANYLAKDSGLIFFRESFVYLVLAIDGQPRMDRVIDRRLVSASTDNDSPAIQNAYVFNEIKLALRSAERRYGRAIENIYLLDADGPADFATRLPEALGRTIERLEVSELVNGSKGTEFTLAALGSIFAQEGPFPKETPAPSILTNWRTQEFVYSMQLRELLSGLRQIRYYALAFVSAVLLALIVTYALRASKLNAINRTLRQNVARAIPNANLDETQPLLALQRENAILDQQLKDLGSPSEVTPLDALLEIGRDITTIQGINVTKLSIRSNRIRIEGSGNDYTALENFERTLKKRKNLFCRIKKEASAGSAFGAKPNSRGFTIEAYLCE